MCKQIKDVTIFEKVKNMSFEEMSNFLNLILERDSLLDDMYCGACHDVLGYCPSGEGNCVHSDEDVVVWFLKQPYVSLSLMIDGCSKYHQLRDSELN